MKRKVGALEKIDADLVSLQSKIRRDPTSYKDDFIAQYQQHESQKDVFLKAPASATDSSITSFRDLIDFISHVADCYPSLTSQFPQDLIWILNQHHERLETELREKIVGSLVLLRRKDIIDSSKLLNTIFPILISTSSKSLRTLLFQKCLSDLRTSNAKTTNHRLNRMFQTTLYNLITSDSSSSKGIWAVKITRELWKRQIWTDSKAVEIMKEASLAENEKLAVSGVRFFLGGDKEREEQEEESSDEKDVDMGKIKHQVCINKKTRKKAKMVDTAVAMIKKKERKKKQPHPLNFSAFHLLHDPQGFAELLFSKHLQNNKSRLNLEQKLLVLQLISRLVGLHKLTIISLYSYFIKYLTPRQPSVTSFLASLAQATHSLVPPDVLEPLVQKIANEFISEAAAAEVASSGLNAIREICMRQPLAMNDTLLQDLVMYRKSKDKGVMMAAKGLLSLYREVGANMLKKRDRGKDAAIGMRNGQHAAQRFGEEVASGIEGLELLEQWKEEERQKKRLAQGLSAEIDEDEALAVIEEDNDDGWTVDEDSDDSGSWINVDSDDDNGLEKPAKKKPRQSYAEKQHLGTEQSDEEFLKDNNNGDAENDKRDSYEPEKQSGKSDEDETIDEIKEPHKDTIATAADQISSLATTHILTPADLAKLQELRLAAGLNTMLPNNQRKRAATHKSTLNRHIDDPLTAAEIEGLAILSKKTTKQDKLARAKEGKAADGNEAKHQSTTAKRKEEKVAQGKSTTNKEKARKKNFVMMLGKAKGKQKRSLVDQGKVLKAHVERGKRGGRRGNKGK
ncbi:MAG: hypothetical protein Q9167_006756 [Letrouitia subvulpina]